MRAWTHIRSGKPSEVLTLSSIPEPLASAYSECSVVVQVHYAALNPGGSIMLHLCPFLFRNRNVPAIPELDFSGVIVSSGTDRFSPGDEVFGSIPVKNHLKDGSGALAEFVCIPSDYVMHKPKGMKLKEAAGLGVAGCTALVLMESARLKEGDVVLVNGSSGGIGTMVVKIAKAAVGSTGKIVAMCSGSIHAELVTSLGADEVIDYREHAPVHEYLATNKYQFDTVIDCYGVQDLYVNCDKFLKEGSSFVTVGVAFKEITYSSVLRASFDMLRNMIWPPSQRKYVQVTGVANREALEKLGRLVEDGKLRIVIDSYFQMEEVLQAYTRALSKRAGGKIVIQVTNDANE
ncbi:zinc alcohol dehydrogenase [Moniliophthora roreri MCA 2997]|uniref:Zinc alcohol dehydrogenase n=2 Tax=Moniliophthora roreri TaxID=221103 RepID=V2Y3E1_MONRO|nr:zinc alcohol dehydrogenase [Moniliophthora roreri MCA 2997]KAI3605494.1 zinc alcohol dehydrogenase [Moniliophthora roreri]